MRKISERQTLHGSAVELEMRPSNWLVQRFVDPIIFTVELAPPHRVLQYLGRTTPKVRKGNAWEDLDALSVFAW